MRTVTLVLLVTMGCSQRAEQARVRAHLDEVERALRSARPVGLSVEQRVARAETLDLLHTYALAGRYPTNDLQADITPIFVDHFGARCAMAALLEQTGQGELMQHIARTRNLAAIEELVDEPALLEWLGAHGLTVEDAALIQPGYSNESALFWHPTVTVAGQFQGGGNTATGGEAVLSPLVRVGVRAIRDSVGACDRCVDTSFTLTLEYARDFHLAPGSVSSTNHLGALATIELFDHARDIAPYVLFGPVGTIDENASPGMGIGGQLGFGVSARKTKFPWLLELGVSVLRQGAGVAVRGGLSVGFTFDGPSFARGAVSYDADERRDSLESG